MATTREELLQIDGTSRIILEHRVRALVRVLDAATELVAADEAANEGAEAEDRYEQAWERLRAELKSI